MLLKKEFENIIDYSVDKDDDDKAWWISLGA